MSVTKEGWGWPLDSRKAHYFVGGRSLCKKWMFTGTLVDNQDNPGGPDDCKECVRRLAKRKAKEG